MWNILTLGGAIVKYLPMTPEGAGVNPYMSFTISNMHKSQITSAAHLPRHLNAHCGYDSRTALLFSRK